LFRPFAVVALTAALALAPAAAFAAKPHSGGSTGIPDKECESFSGFTPGRSMAAPGSAFNPSGTGHEAYETAGAESQYDVACFQQFSRS
jgi:hypothetical protein